MTSRRRFITATTAVLAAAGLNPALLFAARQIENRNAVARRRNIALFPGVPLDRTKAKAIELLNSPFNILDGDSGLIESILIEVNDGMQTAVTEEFSMVFHTTWEPLLIENTYKFDHAELGRFPLYIKPISRDTGGYYYEVTVNRLLAEKGRYRRLNPLDRR